MRRRRIWSEEVPYATVASPRVLPLLRRYELEPLVAVRPGTLAGVPAFVAACADGGIPVALWPMLDDADGRWASGANAERFARFVEAIVDGLASRGLRPAEIALDLEPAIDEVRRALRATASGASLSTRARGVSDAWRAVATAHPGHAHALDVLGALSRRLREQGVRVSVAAVPLVPFDGTRGAWQRVLGTPVDGLALDHVSVMVYTSILEGWSRGLVDRRAARALLVAIAEATAARFGARGGLSLGAVGVGAFGDEPVYRSPAELADDVELAESAGIAELTLLDLGGVLARPPAEAWLEAFAGAGGSFGSAGRRVACDVGETGPSSARARAVLTLLSAVTHALGRLVR